MSVSTEQFQVMGPEHPIVAVLGEDAILPCTLVPAMNAENMELGWFRSTLSQPVFIYLNQREQTEEQMAEYTGRTSLVRDFLTEGHAAMNIHNVQVSDNGMYTCFFRHGDFYKEADLELKVAGMGSDPQVHIEGPEEDGVRVMCKASGWFPKPQVQWRDLSGKKFPALSEAHTQDTEELFSVEATLVVRDSSVGNVTCSVLNPVLDQEKAMVIYIPAWRKAPLYADWRRKQFQAWSVTLDPDSAHHCLSVSHEKTRLTWKNPCLYRDKKCSVLGLEGITSGRCYWEVEIENESISMWTLGVCRKDENITLIQYYNIFKDFIHGNMGKDSYMESPDRGFWVMGKSNSRYFAWTDPVTWLSPRNNPCRVGVFLDYSEGEVSFYNMIDGSRIFSFPPASFSGALFPYFMFMYGDVSMTICSRASGSGGLSIPLNNSPPLEEILSTPREGFSSGCGVDGAPPDAESPLLP
ncbi:butyrophilin subfamily 1 member A1-like [Callospermophilus lateralis]|uniref:butyrophilin subfamily 1 member A1-like n=1 Tax=Callospermophilus lateralis TaxID=76772 RepID=UPI004038696D